MAVRDDQREVAAVPHRNPSEWHLGGSLCSARKRRQPTQPSGNHGNISFIHNSLEQEDSLEKGTFFLLKLILSDHCVVNGSLLLSAQMSEGEKRKMRRSLREEEVDRNDEQKKKFTSAELRVPLEPTTLVQTHHVMFFIVSNIKLWDVSGQF